MCVCVTQPERQQVNVCVVVCVCVSQPERQQVNVCLCVCVLPKAVSWSFLSNNKNRTRSKCFYKVTQK